MKSILMLWLRLEYCSCFILSSLFATNVCHIVLYNLKQVAFGGFFSPSGFTVPVQGSGPGCGGREGGVHQYLGIYADVPPERPPFSTGSAP